MSQTPTPQATHCHVFSLAITVYSHTLDGSDITSAMLAEAVKTRLFSLMRKGEDIQAALGKPIESYAVAKMH